MAAITEKLCGFDVSSTQVSQAADLLARVAGVTAVNEPPVVPPPLTLTAARPTAQVAQLVGQAFDQIPLSETKFIAHGDGIVFVFTRDASGQVDE